MLFLYLKLAAVIILVAGILRYLTSLRLFSPFLIAIFVVFDTFLARVVMQSPSDTRPYNFGYEFGSALWPLLILGFCEAMRWYYHAKIKAEQGKTEAETALRLSQSREAELKLQAQRLEALAETGRMASGINHELRNVIAPIKSEVEELALLDDAPPPVKDSLKILQRNLASAERLMQSLKDMSKPIALKIERLNLTDLIDEVLTDAKLLGPAATVKFEASISPVALYAHGDIQWLHQVLFNLVKNAVESLQGRPNPKVTVSTAAMDSMVRIDVTDNGHGIDPATLQRLFEPFFSTKGAGGTGLGLVVSRKVVELHGGKMEIKSDAGQGTTFSVLLPKEGVGAPAG